MVVASYYNFVLQIMLQIQLLDTSLWYIIQIASQSSPRSSQRSPSMLQGLSMWCWLVRKNHSIRASHVQASTRSSWIGYVLDTTKALTVQTVVTSLQRGLDVSFTLWTLEERRACSHIFQKLVVHSQRVLLCFRLYPRSPLKITITLARGRQTMRLDTRLARSAIVTLAPIRLEPEAGVVVIPFTMVIGQSAIAQVHRHPIWFVPIWWAWTWIHW